MRHFPFPIDRLSSNTWDVHVGSFEQCIRSAGKLLQHRHDFYEIIWIRKGLGFQTTDFIRHRVRNGALFFIAPGQVHSWNVNAATDGLIISFRPGFFSNPGTPGDALFRPLFFPEARHSVIYLGKKVQEAVFPVYHTLESESSGTQFAWREMILGQLLTLFVHLRRAQGIPDGPTDPAPRSDASLAQRFLLVLEREYTANRSMRDYARALEISVPRLRQLLLRTLGTSLKKALLERRLLEARRLLIHSERSVAEIAHAVGFKDPSYFGRIFQRELRVSPGNFRQPSAEENKS